MYASGTSSWNRSLIEFTKIVCGVLPSQRQLEHLRLQREVEPVPVVRLPHRLQALRHPLGVAVLAARADLRAARHRVPRRLGPLDRGPLRHQPTVLSRCVAILSAMGAPFSFETAKQRR